VIHSIGRDESGETTSQGAEMRPEPAIVELVHAWFSAATRGDAAVIDHHVSTQPATRLVGSDPDEWFQGGEQIAAFLRAEVEGAAGQVRFEPSETEAFANGDVGWAATKLTIALPDGKRVTPRWTAVLVREDEAWKFVQTHASIAVPNDQVGWTYD
jgi:ketosteroid isomerase-like protein